MSLSHDSDDLEGLSVSNPLHASTTAAGPSEAYLESQRRARASREHRFIDDRRLSQQQFGIKTKLAAVGFLVLGLVGLVSISCH